MLASKYYAVLVALLLVSSVSAVPGSQASEPKNYETDSFGEHQDQIKQSILTQITGDMSDSRKMGIGALLVIIGSVLYAGFNWNERDPF